MEFMRGTSVLRRNPDVCVTYVCVTYPVGNPGSAFLRGALGKPAILISNTNPNLNVMFNVP